MIRLRNVLATLGTAIVATATLGVVSSLLVPAASAAPTGTHHIAIARLFSLNPPIRGVG
jgi:hypothetical protein